MRPVQSFAIVTVELQMQCMLGLQLLNDLVNVIHPLRTFSHGFCRKVYMAASSVILHKELRRKAYGYSKVFSDSVYQIASHPQVISHIDP
jgi:hypothetical protein